MTRSECCRNRIKKKVEISMFFNITHRKFMEDASFKAMGIIVDFSSSDITVWIFIEPYFA